MIDARRVCNFNVVGCTYKRRKKAESRWVGGDGEYSAFVVQGSADGQQRIAELKAEVQRLRALQQRPRIGQVRQSHSIIVSLLQL